MRGAMPTWRDRLAAAFEEAALGAWRRRPVALATIAAIGVTLTFPALAVVALGWLGQAVDAAARADEVRVFLLPSATAEQVEGARRVAAAASPGPVREVDPDTARRRFLARYPELAGAVAELPPADLAFPRSLELVAPPEEAARERLVGSLEALPGVEEVRHDTAFSARLVRVRRALSALSTAVAAAALLLAAFGVGSVIRIGALARREELAIMRLVGAPRFHVRAPFVLEGLLQGALGGLLAASLVALACRTAGPHLAGLLPAASGRLPAGTLAWLVGGAALAGMTGAALAVEGVLRRHARLER